MEKKDTLTMEADQIIAAALKQGSPALSEYASKKILNAYGIPVTREVLARNIDEAASAAKEIGYPVALKACSPTLMHKSEKGLIALNLASDEAVRAAAVRLQRQAGDDLLEGILIQEMVSGKRELVMGMNRDAQFGPCVMLGLGGVMTEIFRDTVFRMAPFDEAEAADMAAELKSRAILDAFRGEAPVDRNSLYQCLLSVGRIALNHEAVSEIDINPLIITGQGTLKAVDALIVLERN